MSPRIALLIDTENVSPAIVAPVMSALAPHGKVIIRVAYGKFDKSKNKQKSWQKSLEKYGKYSLQSVVSGTNVADMNLIMDAMEILRHVKQVDIFAIVSNDGDFAPLCKRLIRYKKTVIGLGYRNASDALIRSCNQFIFIDRPSDRPAPAPVQKPAKKPASKSKPAHEDTLLRAWAIVPKAKSKWATWAHFSLAVNHVNGGKLKAKGYSSLSMLVKAHTHIFDLSVDGKKVSKLRLKQGIANPYQEKFDQAVRQVFVDMQANCNEDGWIHFSQTGHHIGAVKDTVLTFAKQAFAVEHTLRACPHLVEWKTNSPKMVRLRPSAKS